MKKTLAFVLICLLTLGKSNAQNFIAEIKAFAKADSLHMPAPGGILFVGSSSFTKWRDVNDYFPGFDIINRGFGGSSLPDVIRYANETIIQYHPRQIYIYCGENDLASSESITPDTVLNRVKSLYSIIRKGLGKKVEVVFVSIKPSVSRWKIESRIIESNKLISSFFSTQQHTRFLDIHQSMLLPDGNVMTDIFISDNLHMNAKGYHIWQRIFAPTLMRMKNTFNPVVAHRGAWKKNGLPENSIASLNQAIALGCAGSEFDVRMTSDDSLVINHDPHFHGMVIEKTSYAELTKFTLSNGEKLPTLREYIAAGTTNNSYTKLVCEIKPSDLGPNQAIKIVDKVLDLFAEMNADKQVVYISFDINMVKRIREVNKKAKVQYLNGDIAPDVLAKDHIDIDYYFSVFKKHPEWISLAKTNKVILNAWTVNDTATIDELLHAGFDLITTNEPELVFQRMKDQ